MNEKKLFPILSCFALILMLGCATTVTTKESDSKDTITTSRIDQQDWNEITTKVINSLGDFVNAGNLKSAPGKPAMLAISRIGTGDVSYHFDTDNLTKRIREALLATGKVATLTTRGVGGTVEDPIAMEELRRARLMGIEPNRPDYTLSGKIIERRGRGGNITEYVYVFQLSLTKNPDGYSVWEKEEQTKAKQVKRGVVGL